MYTYRNCRPYVDVYANSTTDTVLEVLTTGVYTFIGDGTVENSRLKVKREHDAQDLWIKEVDLRRLEPGELSIELEPISLIDLYRDSSRAAQVVSEYRGAGGMSVEYLLLLAWVESKWTNTDSDNRTTSPLNLAGPIGPFKFTAEAWKESLADSDYAEILRGFTEADRFVPKYQPLLAAVLANRIQFELKNHHGMLDPPAWLLRLGHRIGLDAVTRFAALDEKTPVSAKVNGVEAVSSSLINSERFLFPQGADTLKSTVHEAVLREFGDAKAPVVEKLGALVDGLKLEMAVQSQLAFRNGVLGFLDFIGKYEAAGNYNAVFGRSDNIDNPRLVDMTIGEVLSFQKDHMGNHTPCGKYQVTHRTLRTNYQEAGLSKKDLFDEQAQDRIGEHLLMVVRKGNDFLADPKEYFDTFTLGVAQEWAALPVLRQRQGDKRMVQRGETFYAGDDVNAAGASPELLEAAVDKFLREASSG
ncbi:MULTISPECIES: hypothetical protein [Agrobacterium]|uniref:hypothetical protein n=1 Tax=Agrobacterium TaxID=357 RepID=UPI0004A1141F|nr:MULTISPECIES: hypothetical protein [Agrobacterium]KDR87946.1 hypothetical protein K538_12895 [Agrobacterium tumefaciens GW4]KVK40201.1 hypothetical protein L903_14325 [Agrobacterium sp. JL28]KVK40749.1 hypothetical protein L904_14315 [Agrobacterium sp. LY4]KVK57354.1 hypothetical protein L907_14245 [Agrobacterium sp. C13]